MFLSRPSLPRKSHRKFCPCDVTATHCRCQKKCSQRQNALQKSKNMQKRCVFNEIHTSYLFKTCLNCENSVANNRLGAGRPSSSIQRQLARLLLKLEGPQNVGQQKHWKLWCMQQRRFCNHQLNFKMSSAPVIRNQCRHHERHSR